MTLGWNVTGHPGVALPSGLGPESGLPTGIQLIARRGREADAIQAGIDLQEQRVAAAALARAAGSPRVTLVADASRHMAHPGLRRGFRWSLRSRRAAGRAQLRPCPDMWTHVPTHHKAERRGFEPLMEISPHTRLAGECLQPLGHLSGVPAPGVRVSVEEVGGYWWRTGVVDRVAWTRLAGPVSTRLQGSWSRHQMPKDGGAAGLLVREGTSRPWLHFSRDPEELRFSVALSRIVRYGL